MQVILKIENNKKGRDLISFLKFTHLGGHSRMDSPEKSLKVPAKKQLKVKEKY